MNIHVWREGNAYIAHALPLDVSSSGNTPEAARAALREAIDLFVSTARDQGTLNEMLEECGYKFDAGRWIAPAVVDQQHESILV